MITNTDVGTSNTTIYTVPASESHTAVLLILCNTSASDIDVTVYAVPNGSSAGNSTMILNDITVPAGDSRFLNLEKFIMDAGDTLVAVGSVAGITATISSIKM